MLGLLGIDDPWIVTAYLACIGSTVLCVVWALVFWNRGDEEVKPQDVQWAAHEKQVEEESGK